ncbi:MAG: putative short chain dehydrogenase/reductase [Frankiales bacterium]|nr:putative short chain dehydrogenase/reductase [Frankiales bacterium]
MRRFENKVVLITGSGAGIGRRFALRFADEGAAVVVTDVDAEPADRVVEVVRAHGATAIGLAMDVADASAVESAVAAAVDRFGGIDVLVNNAGIHLEHAQLPFSLEALPAWRHVLEVNVLGVLACSAACRPAMAGREGAAVVNMSSMAAWLGAGAYGVSKIGVNSLTVSLAEAFAADGIRVNGIAPGLVDSESAVVWANDPARTGVQDAIVAQQMIKRPGRMADLVDAGLFLCSPEASFITGQTLLVDGGYVRRPL